MNGSDQWSLPYFQSRQEIVHILINPDRSNPGQTKRLLWNMTPYIPQGPKWDQVWKYWIVPNGAPWRDANGVPLYTGFEAGLGALATWNGNLIDQYRIPSFTYFPPRINKPDDHTKAVNSRVGISEQIGLLVSSVNGALGYLPSRFDRMEFQIGNEPGATSKYHQYAGVDTVGTKPGASCNPKYEQGSWGGLAEVYNVLFPNKLWEIPASKEITPGIYKTIGPAYSYLGEDQYRFDSDSASFGINELISAREECSILSPQGNVIGKQEWVDSPNMKTASLHFRAPKIKWKVGPNLYHNPSFAPIANSTVPAQVGNWETPAEYATRFRETLAKQVRLIMTNKPWSTVEKVRVTECYFPISNLLPTGTDQSSFRFKSTLSSFSLNDLRRLRTSAIDRTVSTWQRGRPADRVQYLDAIRIELQKNEIPCLDGIIWWAGYVTHQPNNVGPSIIRNAALATGDPLRFYFRTNPIWQQAFFGLSNDGFSGSTPRLFVLDANGNRVPDTSTPDPNDFQMCNGYIYDPTQDMALLPEEQFALGMTNVNTLAGYIP